MYMQQSQNTPRIVPCLWFDSQAEEAVGFYTAIFEEAKKGTVTRYGKAGQEIHGRPEGSVMTISFELAGLPFTALNGGPHFKFSPAISFMVSCKTEKQLDDLWSMLLWGTGRDSVLMPLQEYPFSKRYGWIQDRFGISWQLMLREDQDTSQEIVPCFLFVGMQAGKAEEAVRFYTSIFDKASIEELYHYEAGEEPNREGYVKFASFAIEGQVFSAMDSSLEHDFTFNEAISFEVRCENQEELDHYWQKLSFVPEAEQCGWLKDKFGISWQITPRAMEEFLNDPDPERSFRVMEAMLKMKKIDIKGLREAYEQVQTG